MKHVFALICAILLCTQGFASSPFSLEALKGVNVTFLNKNKRLSEAFIASLQKEVEAKLQQAGIEPSTKHFSNLLFKVETQKVKETTLVHVTLLLVENAYLKRSRPVDAIAITYSKDDLFEVSEMEIEAKESVLMLVDEFIDQFKEENK